MSATPPDGATPVPPHPQDGPPAPPPVETPAPPAFEAPVPTAFDTPAPVESPAPPPAPPAPEAAAPAAPPQYAPAPDYAPAPYGAPPTGYAPAPGYGQPGTYAQPVSASDEQTWSILSHVGALVLGFIAPLVVWLIYKDRSAYIRHHAAEALNFTITCMIGYFASALLMLVLVGFLTFGAIVIGQIVFAIIAAMAASRREFYRYPLTIRLVK
ncbi:MAG: DUF4870 domain-containing protein [Kineosporiaceae bacterium]